MDLIEAFQGITDPRIERHKRHCLQDILFIAYFLCYVRRNFKRVSWPGFSQSAK